MKHLLPLLLLLLCFGACKKECSDPGYATDASFQPDYFEFGYGGGFTGGHKSFVMKAEQLYPEDTTHAALSSAKYNTARVLINHFPAYLSAHPNQSFVCPNCADTYGVGIRARINGVAYFWDMDEMSDQLPNAIRAYAAEVVRIADQL